MIKNLSYNSKKIKTLLLELVGRPLSLIERFKLRGIGSNKLVITDASNEIVELLRLDNNINYCNIEIRKNGIIIRFRSLLETYGLIIPFHKLNIHKEKSNQYSVFFDSSFVKLHVNKDGEYSFFRKLIAEKASSTPKNPF